VAEHPLPSAQELARLLVDGVLAEKPAGAGDRIAVVLNGLGRTKYEELFVVWGTAAALLRESGHAIVRPEVGELVTSLDMAGCSLTVMWLDEELERLWLAPADTPTFRRGALGDREVGPPRSAAAVSTAAPTAEAVADDDARRSGRAIASALEAIAAKMVEVEDRLGTIDAVAGDGDHGRGMVKGSRAASTAAGQATAFSESRPSGSPRMLASGTSGSSAQTTSA
jgi:dihydroxyacetone kinase